MSEHTSRRGFLRQAAAAAAAVVVPLGGACSRGSAARDHRTSSMTADESADADRARLVAWAEALRTEGVARPAVPLGRAATRVGELAVGTPYEAHTLESYIREGGSPARTEPLTLSLTRFDCVSLVEACLAVARVAHGAGAPSWDRFAREMERMRYRDGHRAGYSSRLHYFSEWIADGARRGLLRDLGEELGGVADRRPLRFMTEHRASYAALTDAAVFQEIAAIERGLDDRPRWVVPTAAIPATVDRIETGDVVAFATSIAGLDVTHAALAYRAGGDVVRVLHAPLSGGVVEVTSSTLHEYVAGIRRATGILVSRPLRG